MQARVAGGAARKSRRWRHHGEREWNHEKNKGLSERGRQGREEKMDG